MEAYNKAYAQLNSEQKRAVDHIDGPVLVVAGPGTGKTQLLSTRIAHILRTTDTVAYNILCLTFTDSAAFEMRQRLSNIIGESAYSLTINTYHGFGNDLIKSYPDYFLEMSDMQGLDELGAYTIMSEVIDELPYDNPLKNSSAYLKDIIKVISDCKQALLTPDILRKTAKNNQKFIETTSRMTKNNLSGIVRIASKNIPQFQKLSEQTAKLILKAGTHKVMPMSVIWQRELEAALDEVTELGKTSPITTWKNNWLERDENGEFIVGGISVAQKIHGLAEIFEQYQKKLSEKKVYDYDDMILAATAAMNKYSDLRFTLQEKYTYIHLDEFQDTNSAQLQLIECLSDSPIYEGRPNILAVGDDDQAIYAFQGADYSHMLQFQTMYKDVEVITLTKNYRSHKDILHVAHNIADQIEERLHHQVELINKVLTAEAPNLPPKADIERHEFKSDVAQYAWVTSQISKLIKSGVDASEIAVIAPKHKYLEHLMSYLANAKISVHYEKRENILDDSHIVKLLRMAELVEALGRNDQLEADSLLPEILSYDFWNIPTEKIWNVSLGANDSHKTWTEVLMNDSDLSDLTAFFVRLGKLSKIETLETLLDYLIGIQSLEIGPDTQKYVSPFYEYNFSKDAQTSNPAQFWNLLSNLTVLRQHLREYSKEQARRMHLADLIDFTNRHQQAEIKILNTSPYHEAESAVQLMTAYRAKGMEFEQVFVLSCIDEVWGSRAINSSPKVALPQNLKFIRYKGASNDERLRLLFVAITRAKKGLYLTSYTHNYANKPTTRLKYFMEIDDGNKLISQTLPKRAQVVKRSDETAPDIDAISAYWHVRHTDSLTIKNLSPLLQTRLARYQFAPTHLNSFTDLLYGGPQHFFLNTILKFPKSPSISGIFGNAIHSTIQWIHSYNFKYGRLPTKKQIIEWFCADIKSKQLSSHDLELLLQRGKVCLEAFIKQKIGEISTDNIHEEDFKNEGIFVGEAHMSGKIDMLIIDKNKRTIKIVDFKTGSSFTRWDKGNPKLHKYKQQLYMYKMLVEGSNKYHDYTVSDAYLQFVEPDSTGKIIDLHIEFGTSEALRIKKLIRSVWKHIKELDFPDVSTYSKDYSGIVLFENDLIKGDI